MTGEAAMAEGMDLETLLDLIAQGDRRGLEALPRPLPAGLDDLAGVLAALGEVGALAALLSVQPDAARTPHGARGWPPLLVAAFSPLAEDSGTGDVLPSAVMAACALLVEAGADVNARAPGGGAPDEGWTPLAAALGVRGNLDLGGWLLKQGADPNDNETLYHAAERPGYRALALACRHGGDLNRTPALLRKLDFEDPEGLAWMLEQGADPNGTFGLPAENAPLHHAIMRDRSLAVVTSLLDAGAAPDRANGAGLTPARLALRMARPDLVGALAARGAPDDMRPEDRMIGILFAGDRRGLAALEQAKPGLTAAVRRAVPDLPCTAAWFGRLEGLQLMVDEGFSMDVAGSLGGTALHQAAFRGHAEVVRWLLAQGQPTNRRCTAHGATPAEWASAGAVETSAGRLDGADAHAAVLELLAS